MSALELRRAVTCLALLLTLGLCTGGLSSAAAEAAPEPTPMLIAFPDGSRHFDYEVRVDLSELRHEDVPETIETLRELYQLHRVDLGQGPLEEGEEPRLLWSDIRAMQEAFPGVEFLYRFRFFGYDPIDQSRVFDDYTTLDEVFDLNHIAMDDEGAAVREILPCMQNCAFLDMDFCKVSDESMAKIRRDFPQMEVVWRVWFGHECSARTDVERILASTDGTWLNDENSRALRYCTKVRYLDLGHNPALQHLDFLHSMPELEVAIVTLTDMQDLSDFSDCTKLEFLEIAFIKEDIDLSPLANLKHLHHLNMNCLRYVTGVEALCELKELERLWIGARTIVSAEDLAMLREALPDTQFDTTDTTGTLGTWRRNPDGTIAERYALLREQFDYDHYYKVWSGNAADPRYNVRHDGKKRT